MFKEGGFMQGLIREVSRGWVWVTAVHRGAGRRSEAQLAAFLARVNFCTTPPRAFFFFFFPRSAKK